MSKEWGWALAVIAIPLVIFGVFEMSQMLRRRRYEAIARRPKAGRPARTRSSRGD